MGFWHGFSAGNLCKPEAYMARNGDRSSSQELKRNRQAAEDALQQLDWAIGYLEGAGKGAVAKTLASNRSYIRRNLMGEAEEPLPGQQGKT
jgi:hypothetical protein